MVTNIKGNTKLAIDKAFQKYSLNKDVVILKKLNIFVVTFILILIVGCTGINNEDKRVKILENGIKDKNVILLVVDSLLDKPLKKAIEKGEAPAFKFLIENGQYYPNLVSSFPTMSVTIDSTLLTGTYPDKHKIPGLVWYNEQENRIVNYGNGKREVIKLGIPEVLQDAIYNLNQKHLSSSVLTIHEELANLDKQSASINVLIYRGKEKHKVNIPKALSLNKDIPKEFEVLAPKFFSFGNLAQIDQQQNLLDDVIKRYGFNDRFSVNELKYLLQDNLLPPFSIVYLPDYDQRVHEKGTGDDRGIAQVDEHLQNILNSYQSWEEALKGNIWLVLGDSGQTFIDNNMEKFLVSLTELLKQYKIAKLSEPILEGNELVLAVNERMAYIYSLDNKITLNEIAEILKKDNRIDVIAWKDENFINVISGQVEGKLKFKPNGKLTDQYKQSWELKGKSAILDIAINKDKNKITYNDYPDALARLYGSLNSHQGNYIVVTARPGTEFVGESSPIHSGGAGHGSLHKQDSLSPLIISGTSSVPDNLRIIDLKQWILKLVDPRVK